MARFRCGQAQGARMTANIVGPICETGDTFAMDRPIDAVERGDLAVFRTAGAYGATMASSYNSRGFVAEVMVDGDKVRRPSPTASCLQKSLRPSVCRNGSTDMRSLPLFHRIAGQPVVVLGEGSDGRTQAAAGRAGRGRGDR
jgi:hypothetical protein